MQKNEKDILNLIKYLPPISILIICFLFTFYLYYQKNQTFEKESQLLRDSYIQINQNKIKFQVLEVKQRILHEKSHQTEDLEDRLKNHVNIAYEIIEDIYNKNKDKSEDEMFILIKDILKHLRFNDNRSYIFIYKMDGTNIFHPEKPYLENKSLWNIKDSKGTYFIQDMNKLLTQKNETYYSWYWQKDEKSNISYRKEGFFKKFEPLGIFIGAGEYIDDFEKKIKDQILKEISDFKYENAGYVFIIDFEGKYLSYFDSSYIGKTVFEKNYSENIKNEFKSMLDISKNGGFLSYYHKEKPLTKEKTFKYSYVDSIEDWNWIVGTGFYMDDFNKELEEKRNLLEEENNIEIQRLLVISFIFTIFLLLIFIKISNYIEAKFSSYRIDIEKQINDNMKKDGLLSHQSKMAAMGEMIGNIAHQWRQPLSTISTLVTGTKMQKQLGISTDESEIEAFDMVNKQVQYLSHTIDDFREFFKTQKLSKVFYISDALDKTINLVKVQYNARSINIIKNIENIHMNSLENELIQVLINILNNARDELINIKDERLIFIDIKKKNDFVVIQIKDNGGGICESVLPKIFEPYFTTKADKEGTGIGLFMTQEIVMKHLKGTIIVSNDDYKYNGKRYRGAIFTLTLPIDINK